MIGAVGDDMFQDLTLTTLAAEGIDVSAVRVTDGATGIAHIRVDAASGQNDIVIIPNANHRLDPDDVEASLTGLRNRVSVVLVQLEIPLSVVARVAEVCQALELRLVLDPAPAQTLPSAIWRGVSVVKPNELEAEVLTGISVTDPTSAELAARWFLDCGASHCDDHPRRARRRSPRPHRCRGISSFSSNASGHHGSGRCFHWRVWCEPGAWRFATGGGPAGTCGRCIGGHCPRSKPKFAHSTGDRLFPRRSTLISGCWPWSLR